MDVFSINISKVYLSRVVTTGKNLPQVFLNKVAMKKDALANIAQFHYLRQLWKRKKNCLKLGIVGLTVDQHNVCFVKTQVA